MTETRPPRAHPSLRIASALLFGLCVSSCSGRATPPSAEQKNLGGDAVARVGDDVLSAGLVGAVASAQQITKEAALKRLVDDAVAAEGARRAGRDHALPASWRLRAARARFTLDRMAREAAAKGPPTDAEIKIISDMHWQEVDRPPAARVVHVVVITPPNAPPEKKARARELAATMRETLVKATSTDDFLEKAKAAPHPPDLRTQVEALPAMTDDGWVTEGPGNMSAPFAKAANALEQVGATSPVVESEFGFHVIRLVEKIPERRMPMDARRAAFTGEAESLRAQAEKDALLKQLRAGVPIVVEPAAEGLMRAVGGLPPGPERGSGSTP